MTGILFVKILTFVSLVLVVIVAAEESRRRRWQWQRLSEVLGFTLQPSPQYEGGPTLFGRPYYYDELVGLRDGLEVRVVSRGESEAYSTYVAVTFPKSLGLGVHVTAGRGRGLKIGDPEIDAHYNIRAADPEMVRRLLETPHVNQALRALRGSAFQPILGDSGLRRRRDGQRFDPAEISEVVDSTVVLAKRVIAAREALGPSTLEQSMQNAWHPVALQMGLRLDRKNHVLEGRLEGIHVEVSVAIGSGWSSAWSYATTFVVRFDRPLGLGLSLTREDAFTRMGNAFGSQDIEVGDEEFDDRFEVKGTPEDAVRRLLTPAVRERLVELQGHTSTLEVKDDHLTARVDRLIMKPEELERSILSVARVGAAMAGVTTGGAGPFRS